LSTSRWPGKDPKWYCASLGQSAANNPGSFE
jgi:hypothetical protein